MTNTTSTATEKFSIADLVEYLDHRMRSQKPSVHRSLRAWLMSFAEIVMCDEFEAVPAQVREARSTAVENATCPLLREQDCILSYIDIEVEAALRRQSL